MNKEGPCAEMVSAYEQMLFWTMSGVAISTLVIIFGFYLLNVRKRRRLR